MNSTASLHNLCSICKLSAVLLFNFSKSINLTASCDTQTQDNWSSWNTEKCCSGVFVRTYLNLHTWLDLISWCFEPVLYCDWASLYPVLELSSGGISFMVWVTLLKGHWNQQGRFFGFIFTKHYRMFYVNLNILYNLLTYIYLIVAFLQCLSSCRHCCPFPSCCLHSVIPKVLTCTKLQSYTSLALLQTAICE